MFLTALPERRSVAGAETELLIEGEGLAERALLTDFGLTKHIHSETGLTETGAVLGTIDYAAPPDASQPASAPRPRAARRSRRPRP